MILTIDVQYIISHSVHIVQYFVLLSHVYWITGQVVGGHRRGLGRPTAPVVVSLSLTDHLTPPRPSTQPPAPPRQALSVRLVTSYHYFNILTKLYMNTDF